MANAKRYEELNEQTLRQMYVDDNMSAFEIAAKIGCSPAAVHAAARHHGIKKRVSGAAQKQVSIARSIHADQMRDMYVNKHMTIEQVHNAINNKDSSDSDGKKSPFKYLDAKPSKEIMEELYDNSRNVSELAKQLGVCHKTALNWLREYDVDLVQQKRITKSQLENAAEQKRSVKDIAQEYGCSEDLVIQYAEKYGYPVRVRKAQ